MEFLRPGPANPDIREAPATARNHGPVVIENCAIATMDGRQHDDSGAEYRSGHIVVGGGRITAVGRGPGA
jgi:hypothetical protein